MHNLSFVIQFNTNIELTLKSVIANVVCSRTNQKGSILSILTQIKLLHKIKCEAHIGAGAAGAADV